MGQAEVDYTEVCADITSRVDVICDVVRPVVGVAVIAVAAGVVGVVVTAAAAAATAAHKMLITSQRLSSFCIGGVPRAKSGPDPFRLLPYSSG